MLLSLACFIACIILASAAPSLNDDFLAPQEDDSVVISDNKFDSPEDQLQFDVTMFLEVLKAEDAPRDKGYDQCDTYAKIAKNLNYCERFESQFQMCSKAKKICDAYQTDSRYLLDVRRFCGSYCGLRRFEICKPCEPPTPVKPKLVAPPKPEVQREVGRPAVFELPTRRVQGTN